MKAPGTRKEGKTPSIKLSFTAAFSKANIPMTAGFGLCQLWLSLCFFAPQLFPDNASVSVYEISLVVCAVSVIPCIRYAQRCEALMEKRWVAYALASCAGVGTLIIPFSAGGTGVALLLQLAAGLLTGIASGWFFVAWYQAFCKADDIAGFILSVVASSLFMYLLTAVAFFPHLSPWIMVAVACAMPFASAFLLLKSPRIDNYVTEPALPPKGSAQRRTLVLLCVGIFVISFVDEFMRNYYLEGTDLLFYSGALNLVLLVVKIACTVVLLAMVHDYGREMSLVYRASFLLTMIAVLFMPYVKHIPDLGYGITNFGAFLFKVMVMIVAFNFCQRYRTAPIIVFSLSRMAFSLDLLLGFGAFHAYRHFEQDVPDLLGISSVVMGIFVIITYLFVFAQGNLPLFAKSKAPGAIGTDHLQERCSRLVRLGGLSKRESEVLLLIAKGRSTPRIQEELHLSMNTVNTHTSHVYQKLKVHSRQELLDLLEETAPEEAG
jgi:DNA-binding CsgD family transcriptional regulator